MSFAVGFWGNIIVTIESFVGMVVRSSVQEKLKCSAFGLSLSLSLSFHVSLFQSILCHLYLEMLSHPCFLLHNCHFVDLHTYLHLLPRIAYLLPPHQKPMNFMYITGARTRARGHLHEN